MVKVPESRIASFLSSCDELWQNATQDEKELALQAARARLEKEKQKQKKAQEQARKDELEAYAFYKMRLGELI